MKTSAFTLRLCLALTALAAVSTGCSSNNAATSCSVSGATTGQLIFDSSNSEVNEPAGFFVCSNGSPSQIESSLSLGMTDNNQTGSVVLLFPSASPGTYNFSSASAPAISGTWPGDIGNLVTSGIGGTSGGTITISTSTSSQFSGTFTGVTLYGLVSGSYGNISGSFSVPPAGSGGGGGGGSNFGTMTATVNGTPRSFPLTDPNACMYESGSHIFQVIGTASNNDEIVFYVTNTTSAISGGTCASNVTVLYNPRGGDNFTSGTGGGCSGVTTSAVPTSGSGTFTGSVSTATVVPEQSNGASNVTITNISINCTSVSQS